MKSIPPEKNTQGRILVVDDEPKNRELLHDILEVNGYTVIEAGDGLEALNKVQSEQCDVVLLDVLMPRMDGLEACKALKSNPDTAHIPVLMVSALTDREARNLGVDAGANDYLIKPVDRRDVLLRVRNAVYTKRLFEKVQQDLEKLRKLEILQDNLTHMIIHDMRSPLMAVSWSYDLLLKEKALLSPEQQEYISMGKNCCNELMGMVNSLLDISRMESGQMPLKRTDTDLLAVARTAAEAMASLARKKSLTIRTSGHETLVTVDRDIMHRVFVNLLGNAIKFAPEASVIQVVITPTGESVHARVTDQGLGIPPEFHKKIFEKFGQVGSDRPEQQHSSGLGLTFCKLAVEAHGGCIGVESPVLPPASLALPGESAGGSAFWFTIPIHDRSANPGETACPITP
jgi:two-component system sensor histidine kinase/response regulator